jgi:O-antigen/teichoic acid export membrane protein
MVLVGVFFFVGNIYKELTPAELHTFKILYVIVALYQLIAFPLTPVDGILNAYEKFSQLKLCNLLYRLLSVFSVIGVLIFSSSVVVVILATVISHLITVFSKIIIVKFTVPIKINFRASGKATYKKLFSFTAWTTVINIMQRFTHSFAPSVLGITSGALEIGLYAPAVTLEGYFYTLGQAINGMFLPRVSKYIADKKEDKILDLMIKVGRYQAIVLGLAYIGFVCIGKEFMTLWMGKNYVKSYYLAMIILFPTLISSTQQIAKTTVIAKKLIKYQAIGMIFTGTFGLLASYFMSMKVGALGVCLGTAITSIINILFMNVIYKKKAGINVFVFYKKCYLKLVPCYAIGTVIGLLISKNIHILGWKGLALKAFLIIISFLAVVYLTYTTKEEKSKLHSSLKKVIK